MPVPKPPLVRTRKSVLTARTNFDAACNHELSSFRSSGKINWKRIRTGRPEAELLQHPAGFPPSFFQLILEGSGTSAFRQDDWNDITRLCLVIFAVERASCDLQSAILALAAFLRRFSLLGYSEDLAVTKSISKFLCSVDLEHVLLPSSEMSETVIEHLLAPASVFLSKLNNEPEIRADLQSFLASAIFSPEVLTEDGTMLNPIISAVSDGSSTASQFFTSTPGNLKKLPTSEAQALASCLLQLPGGSKKFPFESLLVLICSWAEITEETEEWTDKRIFLLDTILGKLASRNVLLDASTSNGKTLKEFFTALLSSLLRSQKNRELCLKCSSTLLDSFPVIGLDNAAEVMNICVKMSDTEGIFVRLMRAFSRARLVPKFVAKFLTVLQEHSAWAALEDSAGLKQSFGEEFCLLPQNQLLSVLKTLQYNAQEHLSDESFPVISGLLRSCLLNARLPVVGVSTWIDNVASCLASTLSSTEKFENSSPMDFLQLVCGFGEWCGFVLKYEEALARDLDQTAPNFASFHRIVQSKLCRVPVDAVNDSSVALLVGDVKRRLTSTVGIGHQDLVVMAEKLSCELSEGRTEIGGMHDFNVHPESWECVAVVTSAAFRLCEKVALQLENKALARRINHFSVTFLGEDVKLEKATGLWTNFGRALGESESTSHEAIEEVTNLLSLMTSLPLEDLPTKQKLAIFASLSTVAHLNPCSEVFDAIARLLDVTEKQDEFSRLLCAAGSLPNVESKGISRPLLDKIITVHWNCDESLDKKNFMHFVSSTSSVEVFLTVLERKNGAWKDLARKKLNQVIEKMEEAEEDVENVKFLEILCALVEDGKSNQKRRIEQLSTSLENKAGLLDSLEAKAAEFCLKIISKRGETDVLWTVLRRTRNWRRLLTHNGAELGRHLAEAAKKPERVPSCALEACFVRILKSKASADDCGGIPASLLGRLNEQVGPVPGDALGTLWMIGVTFSALTDLECYSTRDTMATQLVHKVKAMTLDENTDGEREFFCAYLALHAVFLEKMGLKWIFFLGGYQIVMYRALAEEEAPFDEVGVCGFTSACEVLYQALRKPGFVVTGWEHVLSRHLLWAWKLLCRWVSDVNAEEGSETTSTASPQARMNLVTCASALDRVVGLVKHEHSAAFARLAPYVITEAVSTLSTRSVLPELKKYLNSFVFKLLDLCDEASIKYLSVTVEGAVGEVYEKLYEDYRRHGKYVGRV